MGQKPSHIIRNPAATLTGRVHSAESGKQLGELRRVCVRVCVCVHVCACARRYYVQVCTLVHAQAGMVGRKVWKLKGGKLRQSR